MNGTGKQVKWAKDLKERYQNVISELMSDLDQRTREKAPAQVKFIEPVTAAVNSHVEKVCENNDAEFWIDNYRRFDSLDAKAELSPVFAKVRKELGQ